MKLPYRVIDADGHVLEHAVDWAARLPAGFRKDAPGWVTLPDGDRHFMVERKTWPTRRDFYGALGLWPEPRKAAHLWSWEREGQWDPAKRLPDMDQEGIDVAVLFGTFIGLGAASSVENPELACAISEAYNDWLAEYCRHAPDRLKGIAILPLQDPGAARLELRRAVRERGMAPWSSPISTATSSTSGGSTRSGRRPRPWTSRSASTSSRRTPPGSTASTAMSSSTPSTRSIS